MPSGPTSTRSSTTRSFASRAPAGMFQQREICSRIMSTSLALSWLPSGARGCEEALPEAACVVCGGASGDGGVSCAARFLSSASNWPGLYFLASALASLRAICCGRSGDGFDAAASTAGFGGGGGGIGLGSGSGGGGGNSACFGCSVGGDDGAGGRGFGSGGAGAGGAGGASAAEGGGAGCGGAGVGFGAGGPGSGSSGAASCCGICGLGCVARVSGPIVTSWTAIGISSGVGG